MPALGWDPEGLPVSCSFVSLCHVRESGEKSRASVSIKSIELTTGNSIVEALVIPSLAGDGEYTNEIWDAFVAWSSIQ